MHAFLKQNPDVRLSLDLSDRFVDLVGEGYDLAIRAGPLPDSSMVARRLGATAPRCIASPAYLEARGTPQRPEDLTGHDCILFGAPELRTTWAFAGADGPTLVEVTGRLAVNSVQMARDAAVAGLGIARIPPLRTDEALASGALVELLADVRGPAGRLHAVYPSSRHLSAKVRAFLDLLSDALGDGPWGRGADDPTPR